MIQEDRPWYKSWDDCEPLKVKGFSVYFSPKPPQPQHLANIAVYVLDSTNNRVPGKEIRMSDQIAGGLGNESTCLDPPFQRGELWVEPGEYLSASCRLEEGTPVADCAIFVLVEIPQSRLSDAWLAPLFYSQGAANLEYLKSCYNSDRVKHTSTQAAKKVLRSLATTEVEPWVNKLGVRSWPNESSDVENLYTRASAEIFVD